MKKQTNSRNGKLKICYCTNEILVYEKVVFPMDGSDNFLIKGIGQMDTQCEEKRFYLFLTPNTRIILSVPKYKCKK